MIDWSDAIVAGAAGGLAMELSAFLIGHLVYGSTVGSFYS